VLAADGCDRGINEPLCIDCKGVKVFGSSRLGEKMEGLQEIDVVKSKALLIGTGVPDSPCTAVVGFDWASIEVSSLFVCLSH
jgi:hypothetical protein